MKSKMRSLIVLITMLSGILTLAQVAPPSRINYQGVVRDASGNPLNGLVTMTFNFYDSATGGTLLWEEIYDSSSYAPQVTVTSGLFTVVLGDTVHRNGGNEPLFTGIFANHTDVYLGVKVGSDVEMTPRIRVVSAPFAENCDTLDGKHASSFIDTSASGNFLDTSSTAQSKAAKLTLNSTVDYGLDSTGLTAGGSFHSADGSSLANLGGVNYGIRAYGTDFGGYFQDYQGFSYAHVGFGGRGIDAEGDEMGGYFVDFTGSGYASVGYGDYGIDARGNTAGGYFKDSNSSGYGYVGYGDTGIEAQGNSSGGYFKDLDNSGYANVGYGDYGISASGNTMGGQFHDLDSSGQAYLAWGDYGIMAQGNSAGGEFQDTNSSSHTLIAFGDSGINATGSTVGGHFSDADGSGYADVGYGNLGVDARGSDSGGYFKDTNNSGYAYVGVADYGIQGYGTAGGGYFTDPVGGGYGIVGYDNYGVSGWGSFAGGHFDDTDSADWADVSYSTYKINGSGTVSFVQNHPIEKDKVIVYACPEGDEVATYTRGTAKLANGEARVHLGETFQWVTNPDIGLTAHLTPHGKAVPLAVKSLSTTQLVVIGTDDVEFDYFVYGLRIGFEESSIVQEKRQESYIPSFKDHRERYTKYPQLRSFNALERFKGMESSVRGVNEDSIDLSRAKVLKDVIHEYDPATDPPVHELFGHGPGPVKNGDKPATPSSASSPKQANTSHASANTGSQMTATAEKTALNSTNASRSAATILPNSELPCLPVSESVEIGDVLVMDTSLDGYVRLCETSADPMVIGIATGTTSDCKTLPKDESDSSKVPVATSGIVICKIDASLAPIHKGDLLVASTTPGHAMRSENPKQGTVIGKALESLESGTGTIKVLVMLR